jgi:hypothetical protein
MLYDTLADEAIRVAQLIIPGAIAPGTRPDSRPRRARRQAVAAVRPIRQVQDLRGTDVTRKLSPPAAAPRSTRCRPPAPRSAPRSPPKVATPTDPRPTSGYGKCWPPPVTSFPGPAVPHSTGSSPVCGGHLALHRGRAGSGPVASIASAAISEKATSMTRPLSGRGERRAVGPGDRAHDRQPEARAARRPCGAAAP